MDIKTKYVEVASGSVSNRGKVMQLSQLHDFIQKSEPNREIYHSWYCFDVNLKDHIEKESTIQNYKGVYSINQIILDFDKGNMNDQQLLDYMRYFVKESFVNEYQIPDRYYTIWYSGTGFHIHLANCFGFESDSYLPGIVKATLADMFPDADNIYDGHRLIRAGNTINNKSKLYKTEITREELYSLGINDIKSKACSTSTTTSTHGLWFDENVIIEPILSDLIKKPRAVTSPVPVLQTKFRGDPSAIVTCMQKAWQAGPIRGQRNETMLRMASWLKRNGTPKELVEAGLKMWSGLNGEAESVTNSAFSPNFGAIGCEDSIMSQWCDPKCIHYRKKDYTMKIQSAKELEDEYRDYIKQDFSDRSFAFSEIWDVDKSYVVNAGELVVVSGHSGMGKTAFVQNLVLRLPKLQCLFLSLEVNRKLMHRRFSQMAHALDKNKINDEYHTSEDVYFSDQFKHIHITDQSPEINRLESELAINNYKMLVVDTTDMLYVDRVYNEFEKMNTIINKLKEIANNFDMIVIAVHHTNKESGNSELITRQSLKGTSNVIQKADKVIGISGSDGQLIRYVESLKARDEGKIAIRFKFDPRTFKWDFLPEMKIKAEVKT